MKVKDRKWNGGKENGESGSYTRGLGNERQTGRAVETTTKGLQPPWGWKLKRVWVVAPSNTPARQQHVEKTGR